MTYRFAKPSMQHHNWTFQELNRTLNPVQLCSSKYCSRLVMVSGVLSALFPQLSNLGFSS